MTNLILGSLRLCKYAGILYCCSHFVKEYIADLTWCTGPSMLPTIEDDHILFTEHVSSRFLCQYKRGDIVVFKSPMDPESYLCKRVIALELEKMPEETTWKYHQLRQCLKVMFGSKVITGRTQWTLDHLVQSLLD